MKSDAADTLALREGITALMGTLGFPGSRPVLLGANFNVIFHLHPYPIVARVSRVPSSLRAALADGRREMAVAIHLTDRGIPVVRPAPGVDAGPHVLGGGPVVTLWQHVPPTARSPLAPSALVSRAVDVEEAMGAYRRPLPRLGAWRFSRPAVRFLREHRADPTVATLVEAWGATNWELETADPATLRPAHGDLHAGNLLAGPGGWYWTDFEDASTMPVFWDLASLVTNAWLLEGDESPLWRAARSLPAVERDWPHFLLAVRARALLSTAANTWWSATGEGDQTFAARQRAALGPALDWLVAAGRR